MINITEWEIGSNLDNLSNHPGKTVTNIAEAFVNTLKSKYNFNSVDSSNYNTYDLYKTSTMMVIPIIFHKPDIEDNLDYIIDYFNLSYLTLQLKCLDVHCQIHYGQNVDNSMIEYYSVCNEEGKFIPNSIIFDKNNEESLNQYNGINENNDNKCGLSSNKLIECTFYRNEQDENPFKINIIDRYFLTSILATYSGNIDPKFSINTNYFSYYPNNKFIIFKDDCIFLPKDFRDFLVNDATKLKLISGDNAEKFITQETTSTSPFGVKYEINGKNVGVGRWFTNDPNSYSDCWYTHTTDNLYVLYNI